MQTGYGRNPGERFLGKQTFVRPAPTSFLPVALERVPEAGLPTILLSEAKAAPASKPLETLQRAVLEKPASCALSAPRKHPWRVPVNVASFLNQFPKSHRILAYCTGWHIDTPEPGVLLHSFYLPSSCHLKGGDIIESPNISIFPGFRGHTFQLLSHPK